MVHTRPTATPVKDNEIHIRDAEARDVAAILDIINHEITHSDALWTLTRESHAQREAWRVRQTQAGYPVLVATLDETVIGFGSYGPFRPQEGFKATVEHSVYVANSATRRGVGRKIVEALMRHARKSGYHMMVGAVTDTNTASISLHQKLGFKVTTALPQVGYKFDRWLNLVFMFHALNEKEG